MSADQGKRATEGGDREGADASRPSRPGAVRALALLAFGASLALLFAAIAIAGDIGKPKLPDGAVAVVEGAPGDAAVITEAELQRSIEQYAAANGRKGAPDPGDYTYPAAAKQSLNGLIEEAWVYAQAAELGISVPKREIAGELSGLKRATGDGPSQYESLMEEVGMTREEIEELTRRELLKGKVNARGVEQTPRPSRNEIERYYEAAKSTEFTNESSRDVRVVLNEDRSQAEAAKEVLEGDNSELSWARVASTHSEDPATSENGGLLEGLLEGAAIEPLNAKIFAAPVGEVEGIVETDLGYFVFEVDDTTQAGVVPLEEVEEQIAAQLSERQQEAANARRENSTQAEWTARTLCDPEFAVQRCSNFEQDPHPESAPAECYEADPADGRPEACPAPVQQATPALPGTVTPLTPEGESLAQRPRPEEGDGTEPPAGGPGTPTGLPGL